jgi:ATP-dependent DNA ligase
VNLPLDPSFAAMEAQPVDALPEDGGWQYEPKWDGFRCLAFRDGEEVELRSKSGQPLGRYFPDVVDRLRAVKAARFALDGEIVIPVEGRLSFDQLQLRLHPAESRVRKLAAEHPAAFILFDLLVGADGAPLVGKPLAERRRALEGFFAEHGDGDSLQLSPATASIKEVRQWLERLGNSLDGVIAKQMDQPYRTGERAGMVKWKLMRTADCVVGGFRYGKNSREVGSLLLGLYDPSGKLHHCGFTSSIKKADKPGLTKKLEALVEPPGFTGRAPGGPSRWSTERTGEWEPLRPELVVEVRYDHMTDNRFRHGTTLVRWRPDKAPRQCTFDQLGPEGEMWSLKELSES